MTGTRKKELLGSAIPARALYLSVMSAGGLFRQAKATHHAKNAAKMPNTPPAVRQPGCGTPLLSACKYAIPSVRNAMSSVKNSKKKATVDLSVQIKRTVVKMNQP